MGHDAADLSVGIRGEIDKLGRQGAFDDLTITIEGSSVRLPQGAEG